MKASPTVKLFAFIAFFLNVMKLDGIEAVIDALPVYQCKDTNKYRNKAS